MSRISYPPPELTTSELNRVHAILRRRFADFDSGNILNISFGKKLIAGHFFRCVRFWVKHKRRPRDHENRIPELVTVRLHQSKTKSMIRVDLPTDVVESGQVNPTGEFVALNGELACSTGLVIHVNRQDRGVTRDYTGVLTVAHPFANMNHQRIRVVCQGRHWNGLTGDNVRGMVRYRTLNQKFDAAFIETHYPALHAGKYLEESGVGLELFNEDEIYRLASWQGGCKFLRPNDSPVEFAVSDYLPVTMTPFPFFGHMRGVLMGSGSPGDFPIYSSGSIWTSANRPVAMQFGVQQIATGEQYGLGQALFAILEEWLVGSDGNYRILNVF